MLKKYVKVSLVYNNESFYKRNHYSAFITVSGVGEKEKSYLYDIATIADFAIDLCTQGVVGVSFEEPHRNKNAFLCELQRYAEAHNLDFVVKVRD